MINFTNFSIFGRNNLGIFFPKQHQKLTNCYKNIKMMYDQTFQHRAKSSVSIKKIVHSKCFLGFRKNYNTPLSQLTKKKISLSKKGKKLKKSTILKIIESLKGRVFSKKHKNNLKNSLSGHKNPMFGRIHSKFVRRKISKNLMREKA